MANVQDRYLAISQRNQRESPLLRLPAELRNTIYEYALSDQELRIARGSRFAANIGILCRPIDGPAHAWSYEKDAFNLIKVCRQIYAETKMLPMALNEVSGYVNSLLNALPDYVFNRDQVDAITHVRILLSSGDVVHGSLSVLLYLHLKDLLRSLQGLDGLKRITLEWTGTWAETRKPWESEWEWFKEDLEEAVKHEFTGQARSVDIKVVYWKDRRVDV